MKVEFGKDGQPKAPRGSTRAAIPTMTNNKTCVCPGRCFRPTGFAWGPNGKLYMDSDTTDQIFMVSGV